MVIDMSKFSDKCKDMCELDREGEYICCYYCDCKDGCGNSCNFNPWDCYNNMRSKNNEC